MEVVPGVHRLPHIRGPNVYLLEDGDLTLIDTGWPGNANAILDYIRALGRHPRELGRILITHGHPDHTGSARALREATGARVLVHPADTRVGADGVTYIRHVGVLFPLPPVWRVPVDGPLQDGEVLPVLGGLRVVHTPGHTPGSVCLFLEGRGVLFTGDLVTQRGPFIARSVPFPGTNLREYHRSLERVARMEFEVACLAHGGVLPRRASEVLGRVARWHLEAPRHLRWLHNIPRPLRLGVEAGYRHRED